MSGNQENKESQRDAASSPWYKDGLQFECTQCGQCCSGEPGFVWVDDQEVSAIAGFLGFATIDEFRDTYTRKRGARTSLKEFPNGDCVFLDDQTRGCSIYPVRPIQCRTWPFWPSNLESPDAWQATCDECPGAGKGKLYQLDEIATQRDQRKV